MSQNVIYFIINFLSTDILKDFEMLPKNVYVSVLDDTATLVLPVAQ